MTVESIGFGPLKGPDYASPDRAPALGFSAGYEDLYVADPEQEIILAHQGILETLTVHLNGILQRWDWDYFYEGYSPGQTPTITLQSDMGAEVGDLLEIRYLYR